MAKKQKGYFGQLLDAMKQGNKSANKLGKKLGKSVKDFSKLEFDEMGRRKKH